MEIIYENLDRVRIKRGMSISELSKKSGFSKKSINKLFSRHKVYKIRLNLVVRLAKCLNLNFPDLFSRGQEDYRVFSSDLTPEDYLNIYRRNLSSKLEGKPQYWLRVESGLSESTISELLSGKTKNPQIITLIKLATAVKVPIEKMFTEEK